MQLVHTRGPEWFLAPAWAFILGACRGVCAEADQLGPDLEWERHNGQFFDDVT